MPKRLLILVAFAALLPAAELPIREVTLYKHGVGFFERSGAIPAGESAQLEFKADEMNDVLKSLTINEKNARIFGVRYDSAIPLDQQLSEFPFQIGGAIPLSSILDQLKGARIELEFAAQKITGTVVAARTVPSDKEHPEREQLTLLLDSGDLHSYDLAAATAIRFTDAKVQAQFRDYLSALAQARSKDKRSVYIESDGKEARDVTASYIIPTPIWKSSYRLLFTNAPEPTLEGWAIVDNTTGEDWKGVRMALVSGKPISFISQLYAPKYIQREGAELPEEAAVRPELHAAGVAGNPFMKREMQQQVSVNGAATYVSNSTAPGPSSVVGAVNAAEGADLADLFEYRIAQPVNIKKNESAMLPLLQQPIKARKVVFYSLDQNAQAALHPLNAAELTNSTGKTLDGGPITIYDANAYAGEALVETIKANDKRFISYGVDLGTRITNKLDSSDDQIREVHARRGIMTSTYANVRTTNYTIKNVDAHAKTLIIEHGINSGYTLVDMKPAATTASAWRFEVKLDPTSSQKFPVVEQRIISTNITVSNLTLDALFDWSQNRKLTDAARKQFEQLAAWKRQLADIQAENLRVQQEVSEATSNEERLRNNIQSFNSVPGQQALVQSYAAQLSAADVHVTELQTQEAKLTTQATALQSQINDAIEKLAF